MAKGVYERSPEQKMRLAELCKRNCINRRPSFGFRGKRHSAESRRKTSAALMHHPSVLKGRKLSLEIRLRRLGRFKGDKSALWQGGKTAENARIRASFEYKMWREAVFKRDNYQCVVGGKAHGHKLHADHIKPFALFPELRFDVQNGRTLCVECHKKTDTYLSGTRSTKYATIH